MYGPDNQPFVASKMRRATASWSRVRTVAIALVMGLVMLGLPALAQKTEGWDAGIAAPPEAAPKSGTENMTAVPRTTGGEASSTAGTVSKLKLVALLTDNGQQIDKGIIWRVFQNVPGAEGKTKLLSTHREASPLIKLEPGDYVVNAAFGRAHLTRKITLKPDGTTPAVEQFVLNAGGLRVSALVNNAEPAPGTLTYEIQSDRDQSDRRKVILTGAKPGLIIRLNAGIYHIVSTYGDANVKVQTDVTVEAGKLSEATLSHSAGKVTLKLVLREGGEAQSDTQWRIETAEGHVVKETVGALPTHFMSPGQYRAIAVSQGKTYAGDFTVTENQASIVEVLMQ